MFNIGKRIKERRKLLNLSVDDLALKIGKNRATIYRYENGNIKDLPISILEILAQSLETTPAYLMGWNQKSQEKLEDFPQAQKRQLQRYSQILKEVPEVEEVVESYAALDAVDRAEIRGEIKGLLKSDKYAYKAKDDKAI